jgi:hypothetical protein
MDPEFPHYDRLVRQIGETAGSERTWSVPPHNSVMTLLLQVGLPGVVLFFWPIGRGVVREWGKAGPHIWASWIAGVLVVLMTNQYLEVPYNAVLFWTGLGLWLAGPPPVPAAPAVEPAAEPAVVEPAAAEAAAP